jgi:hypothetical protein
MWLRAGFIAALCLAVLAPASAEDDGPPAYAPPLMDYADPMLLPTNPPFPPATHELPSGLRVEGEAADAPSPRSRPGADGVAVSDK